MDDSLSLRVFKYIIVITIYLLHVKCFVCRDNKNLREYRSVKPVNEAIIQNDISLLVSSAINESMSTVSKNVTSKGICRTVVNDADTNSTASVEFNVGSTLYGTEHENGCKAIICDRYDSKTDILEMSINTCHIVNFEDSHKRIGDPSKEYPYCCEPVL